MNVSSLVSNGAQAISSLLNLIKGGGSTPRVTLPPLEASGYYDTPISSYEGTDQPLDPTITDLFYNNPYSSMSGIRRR